MYGKPEGTPFYSVTKNASAEDSAIADFMNQSSGFFSMSELGLKSDNVIAVTAKDKVRGGCGGESRGCCGKCSSNKEVSHG